VLPHVPGHEFAGWLPRSGTACRAGGSGSGDGAVRVRLRAMCVVPRG
jgi:D-arabinose 1-dehydrogenase-like Zn-dependent alcohol dehydrogenase